MKATPENNAKVKALKLVKQTQWVGEITFDTIDKCLASMNMNTFNSGWYDPKALRIAGLHGIFMLNEDGSLYGEQRIIKISDSEYKIEHLSNDGYKMFENKFIELIEE